MFTLRRNAAQNSDSWSSALTVTKTVSHDPPTSSNPIVPADGEEEPADGEEESEHAEEESEQDEEPVQSPRASQALCWPAQQTSKLKDTVDLSTLGVGEL